MLYHDIGTNLNSTVLFFKKNLHINLRHEPKMYDAFESYSNSESYLTWSFMLRMCLGSYASHLEIAL